MSLEIERLPDEAGCATFKLSGKLDMASKQALFGSVADVMEYGDFRKLALDLKDLHYTDSSGLGMLIMLAQMAKKRNIGFKVFKVRGMVSELMQMSNIGSIFEVEYI